MIDFKEFHPQGNSPIYMEILMYIKRGAVAGNIRDGDELPSRRILSASLGINPNTVQKAFKLLEDEGLIESRAGAKSCMTINEETIEKLKVELLTDDIRGITRSLKQMAISKEEALGLIDRYWEED